MGFQKYYVIFRLGHWKCLLPLTRWVGGVKKGQKYAYVILEWSLRLKKNCSNIPRIWKNLSFCGLPRIYALDWRKKKHDWNVQFLTSHLVKLPLWILLWNLNVETWDVEKPHSWHRNFFTGACITEWAVKACFHLKAFPQSLQSNGASAECFGMCFSHRFRVEKRISQKTQK